METHTTLATASAGTGTKRRIRTASEDNRPGTAGPPPCGDRAHCQHDTHAEATISQAAQAALLQARAGQRTRAGRPNLDRKSTRLNSSHQIISYAVFCLK